MNSEEWGRIIAVGLIYLYTCCYVNTFIEMPSSKLPWFCLPPPPVIIEERNPYEHDCWEESDDYCWYEGYDI